MQYGMPAAERVLVAAFRPLAVLAAACGFPLPSYAIGQLLGRQAGPASGRAEQTVAHRR